MQSQSNYDLPQAHVVADCGHSGRYAQWKGVATQHTNLQKVLEIIQKYLSYTEIMVTLKLIID